jgi:hypothetical protein
MTPLLTEIANAKKEGIMRKLGALVTVGALMLVSLIAGAGPVSAGTSIDPNTLIPVPPAGATCSDDGSWIICHTGFTITLANEPIFDLPCGTLYETSTDVRSGIRWYEESDRKLVKRFVTQDANGTWSLSPTGEGPTARISTHLNWSNYYTVPGDDTSGTQPTRGSSKIQLPGGGTVIIAGLDPPEGDHRGIFEDPGSDPSIANRLCAALTS